MAVTHALQQFAIIGDEQKPYPISITPEIIGRNQALSAMVRHPRRTQLQKNTETNAYVSRSCCGLRHRSSLQAGVEFYANAALTVLNELS